MMNWMSVSKIRKLMMRSFQEMVQLPSLLLTKMHQGQQQGQQGILLHQCGQRGLFVYLFLFLAWWVIDRLLWKYVPKLCVSPNLATLEANRSVNVQWATGISFNIQPIPHSHLPHTLLGEVCSSVYFPERFSPLGESELFSKGWGQFKVLH